MRIALSFFLIIQVVTSSFAFANNDVPKIQTPDHSYYDTKMDAIQSKIDNNQKDTNANILSAKQDIKEILNIYVVVILGVLAFVGFALNFFGWKAVKNRVEEIIAETSRNHVDKTISTILNSRITNDFISGLVKEKSERELEMLLKSIESKGEITIKQFKDKGNEVLNSMLASPQMSMTNNITGESTDEEINEFNNAKRANEFFDLAFSALDDKISVELYKNVVELQPNNISAYNNMAVAYNNIDKYSEAIETLEKAICINPNFDIAYSNRAHAYNQLGDLDRALEDAEKAISINSKNEAAYATKGNVLTKLNKFIEAEESLNTSIELNPNSPLALFNRGFFYEERHQYSKSENDYIAAEKNGFSNKAWLYNNMAVLYRRQRRFADAIEFIKKAREQNPDFPNLDGTLALIYADQGNDEEFYKYVASALAKGCRVWNYLSDPGFDRYRNSSRLKTLIDTYKKIY